MSMQPIFRETQFFSRALLLPLLVLTLVPLIVVPWIVLSRGSESDLSVLPLLLIGPLVVLLVLSMRLTTQVDATGIHVRLWPFPTRHITSDEIAHAEVRTYRPLLEYGGWGIRWGWSGMAYNARGNRGVQLEQTDGRRLLIGSQQPEELLAGIRQFAPQVPTGQPG